MAAKIIELIIGAIISLLFGLIAKKLDKIEKDRSNHREAFNQTQEDIQEIRKDIGAICTRISESEMRNSRYRIIRFDDEVTRGDWHSDDHWDQILEDADMYSTYCSTHPEFKNHKGQCAMKHILQMYDERREQHV